VSIKFCGIATFKRKFLCKFLVLEFPKNAARSKNSARKTRSVSAQNFQNGTSLVCHPRISPNSFDKQFLFPRSSHRAFSYGKPHAILAYVFRRIRFGKACLLRFHREQSPNPRWGVVQPVGHLTVNEDGEGSNPSAPANSLYLLAEDSFA
jgi:hypothetical protein